MAKNVLPSAAAPQAEPEKAPERRSFWSTLTGILLRRREASVLIVAIVLIVYFQSSNQAFLSPSNIRTVSQIVTPWAIVAAGEVMLLICGEIDLSVGNVFALAPFIMYFTNQTGLPLWVSLIFGLLVGAGVMYFINQGGLPLWVGLIFGLLVGAGVGLFNGLVTVLLKVPSFITTLGTLFLLNGLTLTISNGFPVLIPQAGAFNQV